MGHLSYFHVLSIVDTTVPGRVLGVKGASLPTIPYKARTKHHPGKTEMFFLHPSCLGLLDISQQTERDFTWAGVGGCQFL